MSRERERPLDLTPQEITEAKAQLGRVNAEKRWSKHREARISAGLPPTVEAANGREFRFLPEDIEPFWMAELKRLGLADGLVRTAARLAAKRLADTAAGELTRFTPGEAARPPEGDDELTIAWYHATIANWRTRAERDEKLAAAHHDYADAAERELGAFLIIRGRTS